MMMMQFNTFKILHLNIKSNNTPQLKL